MGYRLIAAESSIHKLRTSRVTALDGGFMQTLQKNEDTWYKTLSDFRSQIIFPL
jgi:hypothetical protein